MELKNKVAIVTGGAVRIGRAISLALAGAGSHVFIHYGRSEDEARETQAEAIALGVEAAVHQADLNDPSAVRQIVPAAVAEFGQVDILVNNGAVFLPGGLDATTEQQWDRQLAINLRTPFFLCQDFARQIPDDGKGVIINITDARVFRPAADHIAYRLTKSALADMTEVLAHDLAPRIRVNALALGAILPPPDKGENYLTELSKTRVPLGRAGSLAVVADSLLYLLHQDFITGTTIRIDGGEFL